MDLIKKLASRKLGAAIGGGVVLSAASPEAIWPTAFVAAAIYPRASDRRYLGQLRRDRGQTKAGRLLLLWARSPRAWPD